MKRLLVVWHTQFGGTGQMAAAAIAGARSVADIDIVARRAAEAGVDDVLRADALLIGCSENFGGMAGMVKDFLERIYYPCEGRLDGRAWSHFICCGNDGAGALRGLERVATGLRLKRVHPGVLWQGGRTDASQRVPDDVLDACRELGATMAAGLAAGLW
ncbi:MAG TPA: flavodoxin [Casimicrobiaceae bacterium]|nr:flavodoxin [Casimicrobiaceae bacterium]